MFIQKWPTYMWNDLLLLMIIGGVKTLLIPESSANIIKCYGNTLMNVSCNGDSRIIISSIQVGFKNSTLGCQQEVVVPVNRSYEQMCCTPDIRGQDCIQQYKNNSYNRMCNGRSTCSVGTVRNMTSSPCQSALTHFMTMEYFCVPKIRIITCGDFSVTTNNQSSIYYLMSSNFFDRNTTSYCQCHIISPHGTTIKVLSLDVHLLTGDFINLDDSVKPQHNEGAPPRFQSSTNVIFMDANITNGGAFWIAFLINGTGNLSITCGSKIVLNIGETHVPTQSNSLNEYTSTQKHNSTGLSTKAPSANVQNDDENTQNTDPFPWYYVVAAVLAVCAVAATIFLYRYKRKNKIDKEDVDSEKVLTDQENEEEEEDIPEVLSAITTSPNIAVISSHLGPIDMTPNTVRLPPLTEGQKTHKKKKKKEKKKKKRNKETNRDDDNQDGHNESEKYKTEHSENDDLNRTKKSKHKKKKKKHKTSPIDLTEDGQP